tara:strand:+ start:17638 stop:19290 length:1653 start_codon:yes stop_codon:yes gene_type:complete
MNIFKKKLQSLIYLLNLLPRKTKNRILFALVLVLIQALYQVLSIYLMSPLVSYITDFNNSLVPVELFGFNLNIKYSIIIFSLSALSSFILSYVVFKFINNLVIKAGTQLAVTTFNSLCSKNYIFFRRVNPSELSSAVTLQLQQLISAFFQPLLLSTASLIISLFLIIYLSFYSPAVLLAIFISFLVNLPIYMWNIRLAPKKYSYIVKETNEEIISLINSLALSPHAIYFTDLVNHLKKDFGNKYFKLRSLSSNIEFSRSFTKYILELLLSASIFFIFILNLFPVFGLNISKIAISLLVIQKLLPHLQQIYSSFLLIRSSSAAFNVITSINKDSEKREVINSSKSDSISLIKIKSNLISSSIKKPISIQLFSGDRLMITGPSGSGKSSLLDIISGMSLPKEGRVLLSNKSINLSKDLTSFVPQKYFGIPGSIAFNISLKDENDSMSLDLLKKVFELTLLKDDFKFDDLFRINLKEDLSNLSGGQLQRISLARAVFRKPYYLIMDEPTSALPKGKSLKILKNISHFLKESILIYVSHKEYENQIANKFLDLS